MGRISRRSLFYWVRHTHTKGHWVEATSMGLSSDALYEDIATTNTTTVKIWRPATTGNQTNSIVAGDRINIGEERMFVSSIADPVAPATNYTLTVIRGYDGTQAIKHYGGDPDGPPTSAAPNETGTHITRGGEALTVFSIVDALHNARQASVTLINQSKNLFSSTSTDVRGKLTDVFKPYTKILLFDKETHQIVYVGYVKEIKDSYDLSRGKIIELNTSDILTELQNYPTDDAKRFGADKNGILAGNRFTSQQIEDILSKTNGMGISDDDANSLTFRESGNALITDTDKNTSTSTMNRKLFDQSTLSNTADYNVSKGSWNVLRHLIFLAGQDSQGTDKNVNTNVGYDFYATPHFILPRPPSGNWTNNPNWHLNYFQRGARPNTAPSTYGATIKYPLSVDDTNRAARPGASPSNAMRTMVANSSYRQSGSKLHTSAIVQYSIAEDTADFEAAGTAIKEFELLYCYQLKKGSSNDWNLNFGYPIWSGNAQSGAALGAGM